MAELLLCRLLDELSKFSESEDGLEDFSNGPAKQKLRVLTEQISKDPTSSNCSPGMLELLKKGIRSKDANRRKAVCIFVRMVPSEPAADTSHWKQFLSFAVMGIKDPHPAVKNAAYFAFGPFVKRLIKLDSLSPYDDDITTVVLTQLGALRRSYGKKTEDVRLLPHLPVFFSAVGLILGWALGKNEGKLFEPLFDRLMKIINSSCPVRFRQQAVLALDVAVQNGGYTMFYVFDYQILESSQLLLEGRDKRTLPLQFDVASLLVTLYREPCMKGASRRDSVFLPVVKLIYKFVSTAVSEVDYEKIDSCFSMLSTIMDLMLDEVVGLVDVISKASLTALLEEEEVDASTADVEMSDNDSEVASDNNNGSLIEKKKRACEILKSMSTEFCPSDIKLTFSGSFKPLMRLVDHQHGPLRRAALGTLHFLFGYDKSTDFDEKHVHQDAINQIVEKAATIILTDEDEKTVLAATHAIAYYFYMKNGVCSDFSNAMKVVHIIEQVLLSKTRSQLNEDKLSKTTKNCCGNEKTFKFELFETCVGFIPSLGKEMKIEIFAEAFETFFPLLMSKTERHCSAAEKQVVIGALGKSFKHLSIFGCAYVDRLLPVLLQFSSSEDNQIRHKALEALGKFVYHTKKALCPYYPYILQVLEQIRSRGPDVFDRESLSVTVAGMIIINSSTVPLDEVVPIVFESIPIRGEWENHDVHVLIRCLSHVYQLGHSLTKDIISRTIESTLNVILWKSLLCLPRRETVYEASKLLNFIKQDFPTEFSDGIKDLSAEDLGNIHEQCEKCRNEH